MSEAEILRRKGQQELVKATSAQIKPLVAALDQIARTTFDQNARDIATAALRASKVYAEQSQ